MRTVFLTAFIAAALCGAQPAGTAVYIDLSGPWRSVWGDDMRYAAPGFDDSSWPAVAVPLAMLPPPYPAEFRWFRRKIEVPAISRNSRLALTTGTLRGAYEVYVDGRLIGRSSAFNLREAELPRPRTFEFDNGSEKFITIAIRLWFTQRIVATAWIPQDRGPWLLTSPEAAPRDAGINAVIRQKLARVGDLIQPVVLLCLAAVLFLICLRERSGQELLWLVLYLIVVAAGRLYLFLGVAPDTTPYGNWHGGGQTLLTIAPVVILAIFVASWTRQRWIVLPAIVAGCVAALLALADNFEFWPVWAVQIVTVVALCRHVARTRRDYAIAAGVFLVLYAHGGGWTRGTELLRTLWWRPLVDVGGWMSVTLVPHVIALAVFALAMTLMQVRRLVRDREEKRRLASELEAARTVQRLMLPLDRAVHSGWEIDTVYEPAQEVGGDFYVVEPLSDGGLLIVVGDVSGKGLKAAMVVSLVVGVIQSRREDAPCEIAAELNRVLCGRIDNGFVTCLCVRLDRAGSFEALNAGHLAPLLNGLEVQVPGGLPLGLDAEVEWMTVKGTLGPGARLTLMSDGVVEASAEGELFGFERTREISVRAAGEIAETARLWGQNDDITVVTVRKAAA